GADQGSGNLTATVIADNLVVERGVSAGDTWITVDPGNIRTVLSTLKDDGFRLLVFLTCVDHLVDASRNRTARYELVYELRNMDVSEHLRVRTLIDGDPPHVDSVHDLFPPANWEERETFDMFGVVFDGHPDLTRILMPDDWVGYPLRRDYPVGGEPVEFSEEHETWLTPPPEA